MTADQNPQILLDSRGMNSFRVLVWIVYLAVLGVGLYLRSEDVTLQSALSAALILGYGAAYISSSWLTVEWHDSERELVVEKSGWFPGVSAGKQHVPITLVETVQIQNGWDAGWLPLLQMSDGKRIQLAFTPRGLKKDEALEYARAISEATQVPLGTSAQKHNN